MRAIVLAIVAGLALASAALADPLDPKVKLSPADQKRAKAAVLVQADLGPGWVGGTSATPSSLKAPVCPSLRPDYSKLTLTGHAESVFNNGNGGFQVVSDVEVWKTKAQAEQHLNALLQPKLPTCIKYSLLKSLGGDPQYVLLPVQRQKIANLGDVTVHYRLPVGIKSKQVAVFSDYIFMRKGRTEIYLNVVAPAANEKQLTAFGTRIARALIKRVQA
jgi:hypothetical protein